MNAFPGLGADKVVLVTAGAAGIGRVIAEAFVAAGCRVHVCDVDPDAIAQFGAANPDAACVPTSSLADVSDPGEVGVMFDLIVEQYGRLDVLVNNAGIAGPTAGVADIGIEDWNRTIAVDLSGAFYVTRLAAPLLTRQGGSIINLSSSASLGGLPLRSPYTASKWAINGLTRTWAMELGPSNVRVNALCPGSVNGERMQRVIDADARERGISRDEVQRMFVRQSSLRSFVEPDDVANMALFLASDRGRMISGQFIGIDGHTESLSDMMIEE